jgi:hypothetical protein
MELNVLHQIVGKPSFYIKDLILILSKLDQDAEVNFGVLYDNIKIVEFNQTENLNFYLNKNSNNDNYEVYILTKA